ncbi:MAG TPA: VOC family protein [Candidatus Binatia bacterium]|nr:VOC family protein [Candidatus Binatia bacterium]
MWLRLRQLVLITRELAPTVDEVRDVFGLEVAYRDPEVAAFGLENAVFPVGNQFLEVVAPIREGTAGGRYLDRRGGDGGYMVILQSDDHAPRKRRVAELGIRKVMEHDEGKFRIMQLHPRDTGGCLLEIDEQVGGEALDGPWFPAGRDWQSAVRTEVVRGIAAAEIQTSDPADLAARWGQIVELPAKADAEGRASLRLDNAGIRFVKDADGRGEGLGGVDLVVADRPRLLAAAERRGHRISDDLVQVCGVRFRLVEK